VLAQEVIDWFDSKQIDCITLKSKGDPPALPGWQ